MPSSDCIAQGAIGAIVIYTSGFAEAGEDRACPPGGKIAEPCAGTAALRFCAPTAWAKHKLH